MPLPRPSRRALAATLLLLAWVATLGWLAVRRLNRGPFGNEASQRLAPAAAWFALYSGGDQVGRAGITLDTLATGYLLRETISLETPQDTTVVTADRVTVTMFSRTLQVGSIGSRATRRGWQEPWIVTMADGRFRLWAEGTRRSDGIAIGVAPATGAVLPFRLALSGGLVAGTRRTLTAYVDWPGALLTLEAVAGSDSLVVFADSSVVDAASDRLVVAHRDSVRARAVLIRGDGPAERWWIDARGGVLGIETAFGLGWRRTDYDLAANSLSAKGAARASFLRSTYPRITPLTLPDTTTRTQRFLLGRRDGRPLDPALLAPLTTGRQRLRGDTLVILATAAAPPADYSEPLPQDPLGGDTDPRVVALADRASRAANGAGLPLVRALLGELREALALDTSELAAVDGPGGLTAGRARVEGIARLFVAAARVNGMPARLAIGIRSSGDGFESHAWAEVRIEGYWLAVDPAFGRVPAGTGLIRLGSTGGVNGWQLLPQIAQLRITTIPDSPEAP